MQQLTQPIWQPSPARIGSHLHAFTRLAEAAYDRPLPDYQTLWQASVDDPGRFWALVWDYCGVLGDKGDSALEHGDNMLAARFFPKPGSITQKTCCVTMAMPPPWCSGGRQGQIPLQLAAAAPAGVPLAAGHAGSRHCGGRPRGRFPAQYAGNRGRHAGRHQPGCIWTSCSPDFGIDGAIDRFGQTEPKLLFCPDGYWYGGKQIDIRDKMQALAAGLPSVQQFIAIPYLGETAVFAESLPRTITLDDFIAPLLRAAAVCPGGFNHPLFILYSSGTTGKPKCIVHGTGGTLLQHLKEHQLHADIHHGDHLFYFTTCGWMMWNWLVSGLASGATLMLYDGSPFANQGHILWEYAQQWQFTQFGTSAKYIDGLRKINLAPAHAIPAGCTARRLLHRLATDGGKL
jgi:acetoacetyl-CoA synthetase